MELSYQMCEDLLVTALEGGSNYWYYLPDLTMVPRPRDSEGHRQPLSTDIAKAVWEGARVPVTDASEQGRPTFENKPIGYITRKSIDSAVERMAVGDENGNGKRQAGHIIGDDYDAEDADVWFQFVVLGKLVYG